jgi:hypothetical protein
MIFDQNLSLGVLEPTSPTRNDPEGSSDAGVIKKTRPESKIEVGSSTERDVLGELLGRGPLVKPGIEVVENT